MRREAEAEAAEGARNTGIDTLYVLDIFCILSPVWTLESCVLETGMNLEGWRRQLRVVRRAEDINIVAQRWDRMNRGEVWFRETRHSLRVTAAAEEDRSDCCLCCLCISRSGGPE